MANVWFHLQPGAPAHPKIDEVVRFVLQNFPAELRLTEKKGAFNRVLDRVARLPSHEARKVELRYQSVKYKGDWLNSTVVSDGQEMTVGMWMARLLELSPFGEDLDPLVLNEAAKVLDILSDPETAGMLKNYR